MKKILIIVTTAACLFTACSSTESGAINGASLGSILGGSLGGLLGGYRGHNIGTMVGLVAGGAGGAAIGSQREAARRDAALGERRQRSEERASQRDVRSDRHHQRAERRMVVGQSRSGGTDGYSVMNGSDEVAERSPLTLHNLRFVGQDGNDAINRGEVCSLVFELANASGQTVCDIVPYIQELSGNEHIEISPSTTIEALPNGDAIRYTATLRADSRLKAGTATFRIAVSTDGSEFLVLRDFSVATAK